jgi:predicted RNase H-like nuclease (RuvC/YqgF family)
MGSFTNPLVIILTTVFTALSSSGLVAAWFDRRNKLERLEDLRKLQADRDRIAAEHDKISAEAAEVALRALRKELDAAYTDVERRRRTILSQDAQIDALNTTVRRQSSRIEALEWWVDRAAAMFAQLGVTDVPPVPLHPPNGNSVDH